MQTINVIEVDDQPYLSWLKGWSPFSLSFREYDYENYYVLLIIVSKCLIHTPRGCQIPGKTNQHLNLFKIYNVKILNPQFCMVLSTYFYDVNETVSETVSRIISFIQKALCFKIFVYKLAYV